MPAKAADTHIKRHAAPAPASGSGAGAESKVPNSTARRRGRRFLARMIIPVLVLTLFFGLWEVASRTGWQPDYLLPAPSAVAEDLWQDRDGYWTNTRTTLEEIAVGFPIGVALGLAVGALIGLIPVLRRTAYPFVVASQSLPVLALAPLLVLWFGFGILPKVILVVQVVFFPVVVATVAGLSSVSEQALLFGRTLGASRSKLLLKVRIPASMPYVFSGLKISASYAAVAAVIAEFAGAESGLGALMLRANDYLQTEAVFGALFLVTVIGVGCFALMSLLERAVVPWHEKYREEEGP